VILFEKNHKINNGGLREHCVERAGGLFATVHRAKGSADPRARAENLKTIKNQNSQLLWLWNLSRENMISVIITTFTGILIIVIFFLLAIIIIIFLLLLI